jgi:L-serine/L-threonine ammonia-lyase
MHVRTPLHASPRLTAAAGAPVLLKMETAQPAGSYKIRGVGHLAAQAAAAGCAHLVCSSGGNAGMAVAHAGRTLGMRVTVVVPRSTPRFMVERLRAEGAAVEVVGSVWDEADARAREVVGDGRGGEVAYVSPFDDERLWEGHATVVEELAEQMGGTAPGCIVVSVGGGGLFCGVVRGCERVGWGDVPVVAAETEGAASFSAMFQQGGADGVKIERITSIAKSLGALEVSAECGRWVRRGRRLRSSVVSDRQAVQACVDLAVHHRVLVEPACGAAVAAAVRDGAAARTERRGPPADGPVVVIVCGGGMASPALLKGWVKETGASMDDDDVGA